MTEAGAARLGWEDPEWLKVSSDWIQAETARKNIRITGAIEQPHVYPWSTVLRVPTDAGTLFFKATAPETVFEAGLTQALAGWYPECMPELVAADAQRGWMLMRDGGETLRAAIRPAQDISPWEPVITLFSEVQAGLAGRVPEMLALGVPDWRLAALPGLYDWLLTETRSLRIDQPHGLTLDEFRRAQELAPRFTRICAGLAAFGIPETLNHGDFHDGNVLVKDGRAIFFDWGDACLSHPFVTLRTFFVGIEISLKLEDYSFTPVMAGLLRLYLERWSQFAPMEKLMQAYELSHCVAAIVKALAWHQTVSVLGDPLRERYEHILPELFREFLMYEKMLTE